MITLSIMKLSYLAQYNKHIYTHIMLLSIMITWMTLNLMKLGILSVSLKILNIMALSKMPFGILTRELMG